MLTNCIYIVLFTILSFACTHAFVNVKHNHQHHHAYQHSDDASIVTEDEMTNYLMEFDYLPKSNLESGALRTEEQLKDAIRNLQSFGNILVTGEIDSATIKLIRKPRCGVGDSNHAYNFSPDNLDHSNGISFRMKRYVLQGPKWDKTDLTWSLVNQSMPEAGQIRRIISSALNVWESNSRLTFREVYSTQADIQVLFARRDHGDGYKFDGPGQVLAHAFYPGTGRGGDAHFDADETWEFNPNAKKSKGTDFMNVAVHELGHSLGLGHSTDPNAIMYPWYKGQEVDGKLPDDDLHAIRELYGTRNKSWGPYRPAATTPSTTTTTSRYLVYNTDGRTRTFYPNYYPNYYPKQPPDYHPRYATTTSTQRPAAAPPPAPTRATHRTTVRHRPTKPNKPRKLKPDTCLTSYDAISMIRGELFVFRGEFLWRIGSRGLYPGYPTQTRRHWADLPENFSKIDAVYENRERKIIFFIGQRYYVFDSITLERGYPQPLTSLGLPESLSHIDAAFVWGHNNRTYLCSGTLYWRIDDDNGKVEYDYPRDMSIWSGIGYNIDAAFQYTNGKTYFFKGHGYWEFNDDRMKVAHPRPKLSARKWMNCPRQENEVDEEKRQWTSPLLSGVTDAEQVNDTQQASSNSNSGACLIQPPCLLLLFFVAFMLHCLHNSSQRRSKKYLS